MSRGWEYHPRGSFTRHHRTVHCESNFRTVLRACDVYSIWERTGLGFACCCCCSIGSHHGEQRLRPTLDNFLGDWNVGIVVGVAGGVFGANFEDLIVPRYDVFTFTTESTQLTTVPYHDLKVGTAQTKDRRCVMPKTPLRFQSVRRAVVGRVV